MEEKLQDLRVRLAEINDPSAAAALLHWDQATHMPPADPVARARQGVILERLAYEKLSDPAVGELLDALRPCEKRLAADPDEAGLLRAARRD